MGTRGMRSGGGEGQTPDREPWAVVRDRLRQDPEMGTLIRRMVRGWRGLSGGAEVRDDAEGGAGTERNAGRKTLLACSGGADSSALVLGLCAGVSRASERFVVGHVVHDLRPRADALKDRDAAKALAAWIGLKFVEAGVRVRSGASARVRECERARDGGGDERPKRTGEAAGVGRNLEALARTARYRALARMARANGCGFVASAHQVDDAMETVLMRLLRGAGGIGLGGVRASRKIGRGVLLVRPMLAESGGVSRAQSELLCREAGVAHAVDATNADETRLRAYVRGKVSPGLRGARRDAAARVASAGRVLAEAGRVVRARGEEVAARGVEREGEFELSRSVLAEEEPIVIGEVVRIAHERLVGRRGLDRLSQSVLREVAARVRDQSPHARTLVAGGLGVEVLAKKVVMRKR